MDTTNPPIKVLLIENQPRSSSTLQQLLTQTNTYAYEVTYCQGYAKSVKQLENKHPDVILADYFLCKIEGFDIFSKIKSKSPGTPLIIVNGVDDPAFAKEILRQGADDYLIRGQVVNNELLCRSMRHVVEHKLVRCQLENRLEFEKLIVTISTHFISLHLDEIDHAVEEALGQISEFVGADRGYIFWFSDTRARHNELIREWCAPGIKPQADRVRSLSLTAFPWLDEKVKNKKVAYVPRVADLPSEAQAERSEFALQDVQSFIFVPLIYADATLGFLGFESVRTEKNWSEDIVTLLKMSGQIFVNALERKRVDKRIRDSEERYAVIAHGVNDGLWDWNVNKNKVYFSPRWKAMLGYENQEIGDTPEEWLRRIHPDDADHVNTKLSIHLEGKTPHFEDEHRMLHKDGTYRWMLTRGMAVWHENGKVVRIAGSQTDITDRKSAEEQLYNSALHDTLTCLPKPKPNAVSSRFRMFSPLFLSL